MKKIIGFITIVMMVLGMCFIGCDTETYESSGGGSDTSGEKQPTTSPTTTDDVAAGTVFKLTLDNQGATTEGTKKIFLKYKEGYYLDRSCESKIGFKSDPIDCPAKTGYTFAGYNTDKTGKGKLIITAAGYRDVDTAYTECTTDITVYAIWHAHTYTIKYNGNKGVGSMSDQSIAYDTEKALTANSIVRTGYTFIGWNTDSQATEALYTDAQNVKNLAESDGAVLTFYAIWQVNTYRVVYDANGGSGEMADQSFTYDVSQDLRECGYTAPVGMKFGNWNTDKDGNEDTYSNGANVANLTAERNGVVTLYAQWIDKNSHSITYNNTKSADNKSNPKSYKESVQVVINNISVTGYSFDGWFDDETNGNKVEGWAAGTKTTDITLWARWTANQYDIVYKDEGNSDFSGEYGENTPVKHIYDAVTTLVVPTKTGYDFGGWYKDSNCSGTSITEIGGQEYTDNITLYAKWTANQYDIIYKDESGDDFSGEYGENTPMTHTYGISTSLVIPNRIGWTFVGWYTTPACVGDSITELGATDYTDNITLYAKWFWGYECYAAELGTKLSSLYPEQGPYKFIILDDNPDLSVINEALLSNSSIVLDLDMSRCESLTTIGDNAFKNCSSMRGVTMPNSVTSIDNNAFKNCSGLTSITIPNSVTSIGNYAFQGCSGLMRVDYTGTIKSWCGIIFGVSSANPLYYAHNLYIDGQLVTDLVIPNTVTEIKDYVFYNCSGLTSVTIPNSVTSIGQYAFSGCGSLTSIEIPNSVKSIGEGALGGCSGLTSITIPFVGDKQHKSSDRYQYPLGYLFGSTSYTGGIETSQSYYGINTSTPTTMTYYIPTSLKSVTITRGNYIQYGAFHNCSGLTSIEIPNSVTSIGGSTFAGCSGLTSIEIPNSVTSIGGSTFAGCSGLTSIEIPNSVTSIGGSAFARCSGLTSIEIPNSVTSIGGSAFSGCSGLTSIEIPDSVTSIDAYAFNGCSGLTSIEIPDSVTSIDAYAFRNCSGLTTLNVKAATPPSFGSNMLANCSALTTIYVPSASVDEYKSADGWSDFTSKITAGDF